MLRNSRNCLSICIVIIAGCGGGASDNETNRPPTVSISSAGHTANAGDSVSLTANASDTDGSISRYTWSQTSGDAISIEDTSSSAISFTAPAVASTSSFEFNVEVTDDQGAVASSTFALEIEPLLRGVVVDDPVTNADIRTIDAFDTERIGTTTTSESGEYSLSGVGLPDHILVESTGGEIAGTAFTGTLTAYCTLEESTSCHVSPLTTAVWRELDITSDIPLRDQRSTVVAELEQALNISLESDPFLQEDTGDLIDIEAMRAAIDFGSGLENFLSEIRDARDRQVSDPTLLSWFPQAEVNISPTITSPTTMSVNENTTAPFLTLSASDADGDSIQYSVVGGSDAQHFMIDTTTGSLQFVTPPDYEVPADADANNQYEFTVAADDGKGGVDEQALTLTVLDQITTLSVHVTYPTPNANLGGHLSTTRVGGYLTDVEDGEVLPSDVNYLDVNGVKATFDIDQPARWHARVPISAGSDANVLTVDLEDASGNRARVSQALNNETILATPRDVALDSANSRAILVDAATKELVAIDFTTGNRTTLSGPVGNGPEIAGPAAVAVDNDNRHALIADIQIDALLKVDMVTGDRSIVSGRQVGQGPALESPVAMAVDAVGQQAFVMNARGALLRVDLTTGDRTIVSNEHHGAGPSLAFPDDIALDRPNNRVLVVDASLSALFGIDLESGDRNIISEITNSPGYRWSPRGVSLAKDSHRAIVADTFLDALVAVDLDTGNRTIVSAGSSNLVDTDPIGGGAAFENPVGVTLDVEKNRALVVDRDLDALLEVDLSTGDRSILSESRNGSGVGMRFPANLTFDTNNNQILVTDDGLDAVLSIDPHTGNRTVISDSIVGAGGIHLRFPTAITFDSANDRALVLDAETKGLLAIDPTTGDRTIISNNDIGEGIGMDLPIGMVLDESNDRVLVADQFLDALLAIDLTTGNRSVVANEMMGTGVDVRSPTDVTVDRVNNRALVTASAALLAVDLKTGDRTVLAGTPGSVDIFLDSRGVVVDSANDRALIVEVFFDALLAVDLTTGGATVISDDTTGSGMNFVSPNGLILDEENNRVFVIDRHLEAVVVVDLQSGERAIVSK